MISGRYFGKSLQRSGYHIRVKWSKEVLIGKHSISSFSFHNLMAINRNNEFQEKIVIFDTFLRAVSATIIPLLSMSRFLEDPRSSPSIQSNYLPLGQKNVGELRFLHGTPGLVQASSSTLRSKAWSQMSNLV